MKLSISKLRRIIKEEFVAELLREKLKREVSLSKQKEIAKDQKEHTAEYGAELDDNAPKKFSPDASPEQAGGTIHNCCVHVTRQDREKNGLPLEKPLSKKEQSKCYPICTKTASVHGATGKKSDKYKTGSECARTGGKTPKNC